MKINCLYDKLVDVNELKPHPKNRNNHSDEQIERLAKLLAYQGIRAPIVVSRLTGYIVKGHGTLEAIKLNKADTAPVVYQSFDDTDQEYAFLQSDNSIASWSELDLLKINTDLIDLAPNFDIDLLGIKNFNIDPVEDFEMQDELQEAMNKKFILEITFPNEMELSDIRDDLLSRGYIVKEKNK